MSKKNETNTEKENCISEQIADEKLGKVTGGKKDLNGVIPIIFASSDITNSKNGFLNSDNSSETPDQ